MQISNIREILPQILKSQPLDSSYVDIGALWNTHGETISIAYNAGLRDLSVIDLNFPYWIKKFYERLQSLGIPHDSIPVITQDFLSYIGRSFDITYCSGVIYHIPNPKDLIRQLYKHTNKKVILTSITVPSSIINNQDCINLAVTANEDLSVQQARLHLHQGLSNNVTFLGIDTKEDFSDKSKYELWWWILTPEILIKWITELGFIVESVYSSNKDTITSLVLSK